MMWIEENGQRIKTMQVGNATVIVRRPVISEQQQEAIAKSALESYARAIVKSAQKEE